MNSEQRITEKIELPPVSPHRNSEAQITHVNMGLRVTNTKL